MPHAATVPVSGPRRQPTTVDLEHEVRHLRDDVTELVLWLGDPHAQQLLAEVAGEVNPIMLRLVSRVRYLADEVETVRSSLSGPRRA